MLRYWWDTLTGHVFNRPPYPTEDCTGRTVIVTGANSGLGLEAARHFVRLNAAKVILACRSLDRAEAAQQDIEASTHRKGVVECWQLDLSSFESVNDFARRANGLNRLDILINNASILSLKYSTIEGQETMMMVNVLSTLLLSILLLPMLRQTGSRFNIVPHIVTVSSDGAFMVYFPERREEHILQKLKTDSNILQRYGTTKLLQLVVTRKLAEAVDASHKGHVVVNAPTPGLCKTQIFRTFTYFPWNMLRWLAFMVAHTSEEGSRKLLAAAFAGDETQGCCMIHCKVRQRYWPAPISGAAGEQLMDKIWDELVEELEKIQPKVMANV